MKITTAADVPQLENDEVIAHMEGILTKVWDYKSGKNNRGPWSFQNAVFKDESGEVKMKFERQPDMQPLANKNIHISARSGDKGLSGVCAFDDSYEKDGKTIRTRVVKVEAGGNITSADSPQPNTRKTAESSTEKPAATSGDPVRDAKHHLMQVVNAFYLIEKAVSVQVEQSKIDGIECTPENFGGKCGTAFRYLDTRGLIVKLPARPLWSVTEQVSPEVRAKAGELAEQLQDRVENW